VGEELAPYNWSKSPGSVDGGNWQDAIQLLRLVQSDYQGVRRQLELFGNTIAERESLVNRHLQYALQESAGYQALRLVAYVPGNPVVRIGKAILGEVNSPSQIPKTTRLKVRCLGRFEIYSEWKQIDRWQSVKAKSVFQYLLTKPRQPIVKEVLMEMLWPECNPQAAGNNLKAAIHGLRRTLDDLFQDGKGFTSLLFKQGSYMINPDIELWLDVDEFQNHWAQGRQFEKEGKTSEAIREYEKAESLYRGDYLEDEPYEEWTLLCRESLIDTYLLILGKLADHAIDRADYDSCISYSQKILVKDSCREDAYRRLMSCYGKLGQRNRALRWYEICRQTVQTELNAVPDSETSAIYHRLLNNEPV